MEEGGEGVRKGGMEGGREGQEREKEYEQEMVGFSFKIRT